MNDISPPVPTWYRLGSADVVFFLLCLLIYPAAQGKMLSDPGLGWHLRNIDAMLAEGGWLTVDPFTQPRDGVQQPWKTNQWLGEFPLWLGERWAGMEGVAAVATIVLAFTLRCVYAALLRDGLPWPLAVAWTCVAAVGTNCSWIARPNLFTMLFVFIAARLCEQYHLGRITWRKLLWLCPLFTVWANTHGGFIAGFIILGVSLLVETVLALNPFDVQGRMAARRRLVVFLLLTIGGFLCTLINPYGWSLYSWILQLLGDPYFMKLHSEWKPPPFNEAGGYQFSALILLLPLVLGLSKRRPNLLELVLAVAWLHLALTGFRYFPLWVLIAVPVMARSSLRIPVVERLFASLQTEARTGQGSAPVRGWLWSAAVATVIVAGSHLIEGRYARLLPDMIPTNALDELVKQHEERPNTVVFHSYDWGGYLTWRGWHSSGPSLLNWIDDRNEVQGQKHVEEYYSILDAEPGWQEKLDRYRVEFVCVEGGSKLYRRLAELSADADLACCALGSAGKLVQWHKVAAFQNIDRNQTFETTIFERYLDKAP
jgi:hypothetical protein